MLSRTLPMGPSRPSLANHVACYIASHVASVARFGRVFVWTHFMWSALRFGSRAACAVDRNLSVTFAKDAAFGQSATPSQASGNHAAQGFCKNQPPILPGRLHRR